MVRMVRKYELRKTNQLLIELIRQLKQASREHNAAIWRDAAKRLAKSSSGWSEVNISRIARHVNKNEIVLVPGKLLGAGQIDFPVTVAAYQSSNNAIRKICDAGGDHLTILELIEKHPKGTGVRIIG